MQFCKQCGRFFEDDHIERCPDDGSPLTPVQPRNDEDDPLIGRLIDRRFRILSKLGAGGMGTVYRALQTSVDREVALKVIRSEGSEDDARRFMLEARTTSALRNVHTVTTHDFGQSEDGLLYLVMELLDGETLEERILRTGPLPWPTAARVVADVADSLYEAHEQGIVHRDLKPGNIFLTRTGSYEDFVKVLDFGIAKLRGGGVTSNLTGTGVVLGTPRYMAPELARGEAVDARTDLYALGVILFEMLAGRPPFDAEIPVALIMKHCQEPVPDIHEVHPGLDCPGELLAITKALLEKDRADRISSAAELRQRALALLGTGVTPAPAPLATHPSTAAPLALEETVATPRGEVQPAATEERRRSRWLWLPVLALVLAGAVLAFTLLGPTPERPPANDGTNGAAPSPVLAGGEAPAPPPTPPPEPAPAPVLDARNEAAPVTPAEAAGTNVAPDTHEDVADPSVADAASPAGPTDATAEIAAPPRAITVRSEPSGAVVFGPDDTRLGVTPLEIPAPAAARQLRLKKRGYRASTLTVDPETPDEVQVKLLRRRPTRKPKPGGGPATEGYRSVDDL